MVWVTMRDSFNNNNQGLVLAPASDNSKNYYIEKDLMSIQRLDEKKQNSFSWIVIIQTHWCWVLPIIKYVISPNTETLFCLRHMQSKATFKDLVLAIEPDYHFRNIAKIRHMLLPHNAEKLIHAFYKLLIRLQRAAGCPAVSHTHRV